MEVSDSTFYTYVAALVVAGVVQLVIAAFGFGASKGTRVLSGLFGAGFLGYAIYLGLFFEGGTFQMFYYAFIAPVLFIVQVIRSRSAKAKEA